MNEFEAYLQHGWKLCRIEPGSKGPRYRGWNEEHNALITAQGVQAAGLLHSYSGTCALDIDDLEKATVYLQAQGIDLNALLTAPGAVQISSGRPNRGKLLYAMPQPLPSKSFAEASFELRCGTAGGKSAQDVLPPSPHPAGTTYCWIGDWKSLPPIPEALLNLWRGAGKSDILDSDEHKLLEAFLTEQNVGNSTQLPTNSNLSEIRDLLSRRDPSAGYDEWLKIGMAINHETEGSNEGFTLWDEWSAKGSNYLNSSDLKAHWASFGRSDTPITLDSLRRTDIAGIEEFQDVQESDIFSAAEVESAAPQESSFQFLALPDFCSRPEPEWRIPGILPATGVGSFWGQPGSGKTFLAVDIALSVALGASWCGVSARPGSVLYIAAEDDAGVQLRFAAGLASRGVRNAPIRALPAAPVFTDKAQQKALLGAIRACGPQALVFVDTLAAVTPGADENSGKDMGAAVHFCQKVHKVTGGLVILIHHDGKTPGKGPRGWSGLNGAFDVAWEITDQETHREMRISKMKNAAANQAYGFHLAPYAGSCIVEWS